MNRYGVWVRFLNKDGLEIDSDFLGLYWGIDSEDAISEFKIDASINNYKINKPKNTHIVVYFAKKED